MGDFYLVCLNSENTKEYISNANSIVNTKYINNGVLCFYLPSHSIINIHCTKCNTLYNSISEMEDIPENESLEDILYGTRQCKCGEKYTSEHVYVKLLPRYIMFDKYVENSITITTKERSTRIVLYESVPSRFKTFNNMNSDSSFHYNYNYKYVGENDDYYDEI